MSNKCKAAVSTFRSFPRLIRWSSYALSGYLIYAALLGLLVPYIAKQHIPQQVSKLIERPVTLTDIRINPFTLQFDIDQFAVLEESKPLIQFEQASLQLNFWQSIFNTEISVEYLSLNKPYINIERLNNGNQNSNQISFNFSTILEAIARNTASSEEPESVKDQTKDRQAPLFPVLIKQIALVQGNVRFFDVVSGAELNYPEINLTLGEFSTQSLLSDTEKRNEYKLHITDADSATVAIKGQVQLKPLEVVGDIDVQKIQLSRLWRLIEKSITAKLTSGEVNLTSNYHIAQTFGQTEADDTMSITSTNGIVTANSLNFAANGKSVVSLPTIAINNIVANIEKQNVTIASITSRGLKVSTKVDENGSDLVTLFTPKSSSNASGKKSGASDANESNTRPSVESTSPWLVTLNRLKIENYQLNVDESLVTNKSNQWVLSPINLTTKQIVSDLSKPIDFDLFTSVNGKGDVSVKGQANAKQQTVVAAIDVKSLTLAQFQPYLATAINATLTQGEISTQAKLDANAEGKVEVSGGAQVYRLSIRDNQLKEPFVKWQSLAINHFNFDLLNSTLTLDTLALDQPYARVVINQDRSTNIGDLLVAKPNNGQNETKSQRSMQEQPFALSVKKVTFTDGSAFFADNSLTPNFASGIEQLEGNVGQLSSVPGTKATVDLGGKIDKYAPVKVSGEINPLLESPYLDLDVMFKNVELTTVNPYSGTYAGRYIDKGQLSLELKYRLENNKLKGSNHMTINQLKLGKASNSKEATSLPLDLAIALLQDRNGVIDLGIDVAGDVNDPTFNLGSVIWHAVSNIITKAVTAPFSLIANLVGSDKELNSIAFAYGMNTLSVEAQEKLNALGKALESRPKLTLSVDGVVSTEEDSKALALQKFNQKLAAQADLTVAELPMDLSASAMPVSGVLSEALQALYQIEFGEKAQLVLDTIEDEHAETGVKLTKEELAQRWHIALYNFVLNRQKVTQEELNLLAQQRAQTVKAYLVDVVNINAKRVFLLDSRFDVDKDSSSALLSLDAH
jgi:hypothetical protein